MRRDLPFFGIIVLLVGCAHAPSVTHVPVQKEGKKENARTPVVFYTLPKTEFTIDWTTRQGLFIKGPLSKEVEELKCTVEAQWDLDDPCYWRFRSREPNRALFDCNRDTDGNTKAYLLEPGRVEIGTLGVPDSSHQYAIALKPAALQRLKTELEFSAQGGLVSMQAHSTSLVAASFPVLAAALHKKIIATLRVETSPLIDLTRPSDALKNLARELAALERQKEKATNAAVVAELSARQGRLRMLAEGAFSEAELVVRFSLIPEPCDVNEDSCTIGAEHKRNVGEMLNCVSSGVGSALVTLERDPDSRALAKNALNSSPAVEQDGLRYRVPVTAKLVLRLDQEDVAEAQVQVPQWGAVLSLPRKLGWASGAMTARFDPQTGALLSLSSEMGDSGGASMVNYVAQELTRDREIEALKREKEALEFQASICNSRRALGRTLGSECGPQ